ncbi:MAG TPA: ABC transporter substrate-binding protein, partial [Dehalococcoidia bacterium]|nr:ABC transporter substrate-binding protein [Dehalococcoidia bacterium]
MSEWTVAKLAEQYRSGRLTRRRLIARMVSAGLGAPVIAGVLAACSAGSTNKGSGAAQAGTGSDASSGANDTFQPAKRGGGGTLKLLWWQGPSILNAHLSTGTKDSDGSRLFTEPLAAWDPDGNPFPILAAEIPSIEKGTLDKEGKSVTWKLKKAVQWHDGQPFTADDVIFTWQYTTDPATGSTRIANYSNVAAIDKIDDSTVKISFKDPTPYWQIAFFAGEGHVLPKHVLEPFKGKEARNAPFNLKPVGTGPYKIVDFRSGDLIIAEINQNYHVPNRPFFDRVEL